MSIVTQIVAVSRNMCIGKDGKIPWNIPEDMKFFRKTTHNSIIIMGRKTADSIGRNLPNRRNFVITRQDFYSYPNFDPPNRICNSVEDAINMAKECWNPTIGGIFVIGGAEIYKQAMPYTDKILMTMVDMDVDGDTFYETPDPTKFNRSEDVLHLTDNAKVISYRKCGL